MELRCAFPETFKVEGIGPIDGPVELGTFRGPGLYLLVGPNGEGKTSILTTLLNLAGGQLRGDRLIHVGRTSAHIEMAPLRVSLQIRDGAIQRTQEGGELLARVRALPNVVEGLIHAEHRKAPDAAARARLSALLAFRPIPATDSTRDALLRAIKGACFEEIAADDPIRATWDQLVLAGVGGSKKIASSLRSREDLVRDLAKLQAGAGVLDQHEELAALLNACATAAGHARGAQELIVASLAGAVDEILGQAAGELGSGWESRMQEEFVIQAADRERWTVQIAMARVALAIDREQRAAGLAAEERRDRQIESLGQCPETASFVQRVEAAELEVLAAKKEFELADSFWTSAEEQREIALAVAIERQEYDEEFLTKFGERIGSGGHLPSSFEEAECLSADLAAMVEEWRSSRPNYETADLSEFEGAAQKAEGVRAQVALLLGVKQGALQAAREQLSDREKQVLQWQAQKAAIEAPIDAFPTEESVMARAAILKVMEDSRRIEFWGSRLTAARAEVSEAKTLADRFRAFEDDYRLSARATWGQLGVIVTDALAVPCWMADGLRLFVGYQGRELARDADVIERARAAAADAKADEDGSVLWRARELSAAAGIEWRDIADPTMLSLGELHEACLEVLKASPPKPGDLVVIPFGVLDALGEVEIGSFDDFLAAAGAIGLSERPPRKGDRPGLWLERWADRRGVA